MDKGKQVEVKEATTKATKKAKRETWVAKYKMKFKFHDKEVMSKVKSLWEQLFDTNFW